MKAHVFGRSLAFSLVIVGSFFVASFCLFSREALAIPSFSAQTNQPCSACHVGAFGPQLKPYGRDFKLYGYVTSDRPDDNLADNWSERVSIMAQGGFNQSGEPMNGPGVAGVGGDHDLLTLNQVSVYYGGRITPEIGMIQELSYDGVGQNFFWDALDVRHAWEGTILGTDYVGGLVVGNQLGNTSIWNSTPPNGFPYISSAVAPSPQAGTLFDDSLNGQIMGPGAYISWNDWVYAETNVYFPLSHNFDQAVGAPMTDKYDGVIPFWHIALQHDFDHHEHYAQVGTFGAIADRYPSGLSAIGPVTTTGPRDHISDVGVEANYQWLADMHNMVSAHATYIRESQDLNATYGQGFSSNLSDSLNEFKADVTYAIDDTYVPSLQYFKTTGTNDALIYGGAGSPANEGYTVDLAYVPFGKPDSPGYNWGNMRVGLQYTGYTVFNGTSHNASDNNTVLLSFWFIAAPLAPIFDHQDSASAAH